MTNDLSPNEWEHRVHNLLEFCDCWEKLSEADKELVGGQLACGIYSEEDMVRKFKIFVEDFRSDPTKETIIEWERYD